MKLRKLWLKNKKNHVIRLRNHKKRGVARGGYMYVGYMWWSATVTGRVVLQLGGQVNWPPVRAKQLSRQATCDFIIISANLPLESGPRNL